MNLAQMIQADDPAVAAAVGTLATHGAAPSTDAAYEMGATGGPVVEAERVAFEAWMRGHCWALSATWTGTQYLSDAEHSGYVDPRAMGTRRLWAAWRDRAALSLPVVHAPLAAEHEGMRVDYQGLLGQARRELRGGCYAEMLRQLTEHLTELGQRYYAGDVAAVDEFLQLYCVGRDARALARARMVEGGAA